MCLPVRIASFTTQLPRMTTASQGTYLSIRLDLNPGEAQEGKRKLHLEESSMKCLKSERGYHQGVSDQITRVATFPYDRHTKSRDLFS